MREPMRECPACRTRVLPTADQLCPACRRYSFASGSLITSATPTPTAGAQWSVDAILRAFIVVFSLVMAVATVLAFVGAAPGPLVPLPAAAPTWSRLGLLAMGCAGVVSLAGLAALWKRRRSGVYLFDAAALGAFVLNLTLGAGLALSLLGLLGAASLTGLIMARWRDFH